MKKLQNLVVIILSIIVISFYVSPGRATTTNDVVYVANFGGGLVRGFTLDGSDLGNITTNPVTQAVGVALDASKNIYVVSASDNNIRRFSPSGADLGIFASTGLNSGRAVIFDSAGNLYVDNVGDNT